MGSQIRAIVDYSAARVASHVQGITLPNGSVVGIRSTFGAGQNLIVDPLRPGQMIASAPESPSEPFQHWSEIPDAPEVAPYTQDGMVELIWDIPMRLWMARSPFRDFRANALALYDPYISAFATDHQLGGLCELAHVKSIAREADAEWAWIDIGLYVREHVYYP